MIRDAKTLVVKIGSSLVTNEGRGLDAAAGGDFDLVGHFVRRPLVKKSAVAAVQAFSVLADDDHVDIAALHVGQRRGHAGKQARRAEVDVLIQLEAHPEQDFRFEDPLGNLRAAARIDTDRAEEDGVMLSQLFQR